MRGLQLSFKFSKAKIGFVGPGNMGGPMAKNLASKGFEVFAFDAVII